jgi:hypothetical protein
MVPVAIQRYVPMFKALETPLFCVDEVRRAVSIASKRCPDICDACFGFLLFFCSPVLIMATAAAFQRQYSRPSGK